MKICEKCKKMFEDYEDYCPDCNTELQYVEVVGEKKNNNAKIFGFSCLGCFGCLGIIFLLHIILFAFLYNNWLIRTSEYKYNDLRGEEAKNVVTEKMKSIDELVTSVLINALLEQRAVNQYSTPTEVLENVFLQHPDNLFGRYDAGFTNPEVCNEPAVVDQDGNIYCITNWTIEDDRCDLAGQYPCSPRYSTPNLYVDINGATKPNVLTDKKKEMNDIFTFSIYANKVKRKGVANKISY